MDRADADGHAKHVAQQLFHPTARTAADQGQYELIEPLRRYRQMEQDVGVAGGKCLIKCKCRLVLLAIDELPSNAS